MRATKERLDTWRESSPMRKWREKEGFGLHDAAAVLGVSVSTLQTLEAGRLPTDAMAKRIARRMGYGSARSLQSSYMRWWNSRPT